MGVKCEATPCEDSAVEFLELDDDDGWNLCGFHHDLTRSLYLDTEGNVEDKTLIFQAMGLRRHTDQELEERITLRGQRVGGGC